MIEAALRSDAAVRGALLEVLDAAGVAVFVEKGRRLLAANTAMCELFGLPRAELLAADLTALLAPNDRAVMTEHRDDESGRISIRSVSILRAGGEPTPTMLASFAREDGTRVGILLDRSSLDAVQRERDLLAAVLDLDPAGVLVWNGAGASRGSEMRLEWLNQRAADLLGVDRSTVIGRRFGELIVSAGEGEADRGLAICGTSRVEHLPAMPISEAATLRRTLYGLPGRRLAVRVEDVAAAREAEAARRELAERLLDLSDAERRRLASELHDDAIQNAAATATALEGLLRHPERAADVERIEPLAQSARRLVTSLRQLVFELSPAELPGTPLAHEIGHAAAFILSGAATDARVDVNSDVGDLPPAVHIAAIRIVTEALINVRKHARATTVKVVVGVEDGNLVIDVVDDGVGLGVDTHPAAGHFGMRSMQERAALLGGTCTISPASGRRGTHVRAVLPVTPAISMPTPPAWMSPRPREELDDLRAELRDAAAAVRAEQEHSSALRRRLAGLVETLTALSAAGDTEETLRTAVHGAAKVLGDGAAVHIVDESTGTFATAMSSHDRPEDHVQLRRLLELDRPDGGHVGTAVRSQVEVVVDPRTEDHGLGPLIRRAVVAPFSGGKSGALTVHRGETQPPFDDEDLRVAQLLARNLGAALDRLHDRAS